jgi:hypothetical protein
MSLRVRLLMVISLALLGVATVVPGARASAAGRLAVTALSFSPASVDASTGTATATLTWTITDSNASATDIAGQVDIREEAHNGGYIGVAYVAPFDLTGAITGDENGNGSGTAQQASFSYTFSVPQYANATTANWVISGASIQDNQSDSADISGAALTGYGAVLTATELQDTTPPTYQQLAFNNPDQRPYVYDNGTSNAITYTLTVLDPDSGFWKGTLVLSGPDGQVVITPFSDVYSVTQAEFMCGQGIGFGLQNMTCTFPVTIPANAAAGTWRVSSITLTSNSGSTETYGDLDALPITVTADNVIQASGFTVNPNPVNNWDTDAYTTLTMSVTGESGGVSAIYVDLSSTSSACGQSSTTPTLNSDGTYSVPLYMLGDDGPGNYAPVCTVTGIAVLDGAGDVSLYGSEYGAPDPGITITQVPDTTPPAVTAASLSPATLPYSADAQSDNLALTIDDPVAPVTQVSVFLTSSSGSGENVYCCSVQSTLNGTLTTGLSIPAGLAPGTYTVGFQLTDAAGLTSTYGTSTGLPVPGGPLTLTITSS